MTARCRRPECGRPLRTDESVARGYGPVCWQRMHPWVYVPRPVAGDDPDQIPLPLEATVDQTFEITMEYTRTMTFNVKAVTAFEAFNHAASAFAYDDLQPDDEGLSELELTAVTLGDRELRIHSHFDFNAPKVNGLSPRKYVAYEGSTRLGESGDLEALLDEHLAPNTSQEGPAA